MLLWQVACALALAASIAFAEASGAGQVGGTNGLDPDALEGVVVAHAGAAGAHAFTLGLVGIGLAALVFSLVPWATPDGLARPFLVAGLGAAALWVVGGAIMWARVDLAGHFNDAQAARGAIVLGYLVATGPLAWLLLGIFLFGFGQAARQNTRVARWYGGATAWLGLAAAVGAASLAAQLAGMLALAAMPLWGLLTATMATRQALRREVMPLAAVTP